VRGILRDLVESGLVFVTGNGDDAAYRVVSPDDVADELRESSDVVVWALVYREGPFSLAELSDIVRADRAALEASLMRLVEVGRVQKDDRDGVAHYSARQFLVEREASAGWEAAVYDHFHALVRTLCARLDPDTAREGRREHIGGATYSLDIAANHPLRERVLGTLERLRGELSELRRQVNEHNRDAPPGPDRERVVIYAGQCVLPGPSEEK
jgi:hypothetical protein